MTRPRSSLISLATIKRTPTLIVQVTMEINIHVVGQDRPSVINDLVMLYM